MAQNQVTVDVQMPAADSLEFRLLMAYVHKRRPDDTRLQQNIPDKETSSAERSEPKKKRKKKRFSFLKCIKAQTDDVPEREPAVLKCSDSGKVDDMENMVSALTKISDSVHFTPCEIESDNEKTLEDEMVEQLAELLRAHGDDLNEKIEANSVLREQLKSSFQYRLFKKVISSVCGGVSSYLPPQQTDVNVDVALICEATSKLSGISYYPMNRVLGFGAKYLQENHPTWVTRNMHESNGVVSDETKEEVQ